MNLCEILHEKICGQGGLSAFLQVLSAEKEHKIRRIYLGSSFCSQYFLKFSGFEQVFAYCAEEAIPVSLTVPVFSQKDIEAGKTRITQLCEIGAGCIDEITVNDVGMLVWMQDKAQYRINLGRLFFKDPRDCRVPDQTAQTLSPVLLSNLSDPLWRRFRFDGVEIDPTNRVLDLSAPKERELEFGVHLPYCYMTTGNICKFASIHKNIQEKFRPNLHCGMECLYVTDIYSGHVRQTDCDPVLHRFGRTLYFRTERPGFTGRTPSRTIYFPIDEWRKFIHENSGSGQ